MKEIFLFGKKYRTKKKLKRYANYIYPKDKFTSKINYLK